MSTPQSVRISRDGKEIGEHSVADALRLLADGTLRNTDHYWQQGMTDWALLSGLKTKEEMRIWNEQEVKARIEKAQRVDRLQKEKAEADARSLKEKAEVAEKTQKGAEPVVTTTPVQPKPEAAPTTPPPAAKPLVIEKGFSPYATYYRSKDDRWAYGIFGGLAHRNCWSSAQLEWVRFLTLIFIVPAIAYLFGWGLMVMFLTPPLPTTGVRSYYDIGPTPNSNITSFLKTIGKVILWIFAIMLVLQIVGFLYRFVFKS